MKKLASLTALLFLLSGCGSAQPSFVVGSGSSPSGSPSAEVGLSVAASASPSASASPGAKPVGKPCNAFPADNVWRADVSKLPVSKSSAAYVASIGSGAGVHADFGAGLWDGGPIGIPVTAVKSSQAKVKVSFSYARESDKGPYPIPSTAKIEGGPNSDGDRHVILLDAAGCKVYELYAAARSGSGWKAGSGAIFDLRSNKLRTPGWTSADAAGLSIYAGLVRYDEVAAGHIDHAIRVTVPQSQSKYLWPARHQAGSGGSSLPPMGLRLRLKASVNISPLPKQARIVAEAMKKYGVIVADNGSPWYISGTPDDRWSNDALHALGRLHGSDFEAVDASGLMADPNSAAVK